MILVMSHNLFLHTFFLFSYTKNSSVIEYNMNRFILYVLGFIFLTIGFTFFILYFNLFIFGYSFIEYILFLIGRWECYSFVIGIFLIVVAMVRKEKKR